MLAQPNWRCELRDAVRTPQELCRLLALDWPTEPAAEAAHRAFPLLVPRPFVARMQRGDPADPLLRQVLPLAAEVEPHAGYLDDPVGDRAARRAAGVIVKYHGRALLIATASCAINCRYCFRRAFPYREENAGRDRFAAALDYLRATPAIREVILSGGDPLTLATARLKALTDRLAPLPHLQRIRVHSRLPVVLPSRITPRLLAWFRALPWPVALVIHCNHPNELNPHTGEALAALRTAGVTLLNQTVLLAGVNDDAAVQQALAEKLYAQGVLPYYLHRLDPVTGSHPFTVATEQALAIQEHLRCRLPGYLVPRLVREEAGKPYKVPVL